MTSLSNLIEWSLVLKMDGGRNEVNRASSNQLTGVLFEHQI